MKPNRYDFACTWRIDYIIFVLKLLLELLLVQWSKILYAFECYVSHMVLIRILFSLGLLGFTSFSNLY